MNDEIKFPFLIVVTKSFLNKLKGRLFIFMSIVQGVQAKKSQSIFTIFNFFNRYLPVKRSASKRQSFGAGRENKKPPSRTKPIKKTQSPSQTRSHQQKAIQLKRNSVSFPVRTRRGWDLKQSRSQIFVSKPSPRHEKEKEQSYPLHAQVLFFKATGRIAAVAFVVVTLRGTVVAALVRVPAARAAVGLAAGATLVAVTVTVTFGPMVPFLASAATPVCSSAVPVERAGGFFVPRIFAT